MAKFDLPYRNVAEAVKDNFAKIGGPETALSYLKQGYYNAMYRKVRQQEQQALLRRVKTDQRFADLVRENNELRKKLG